MENEKIKSMFLEKYYNDGDYSAFEILQNNVGFLNDYKLKRNLNIILPVLFRLNYLVIEYQEGTENEKINKILIKYNIENFYIETKGELFNILGITDKDLNKYN